MKAFASMIHSFDNTSHCIAIGTLPIKSFKSADDANEFLQEINSAHRAAVKAEAAELLEQAAVTAWTIGMTQNRKVFDVRDIGAMIAKAVRAIDIDAFLDREEPREEKNG